SDTCAGTSRLHLPVEQSHPKIRINISKATITPTATTIAKNQVSSDASAPCARHGGVLLTFSTSPAVEHPKVSNFTGAQQPAGVIGDLEQFPPTPNFRAP